MNAETSRFFPVWRYEGGYENVHSNSKEGERDHRRGMDRDHGVGEEWFSPWRLELELGIGRGRLRKEHPTGGLSRTGGLSIGIYCKGNLWV